MILTCSEEIVMSLYRNLTIENKMKIFKMMEDLEELQEKKSIPMKKRTQKPRNLRIVK